MEAELLWSRYNIELWKTYYGAYDRPSFHVIQPDQKVINFPSFEKPDCGMQALAYIRKLRGEIEGGPE